MTYEVPPRSPTPVSHLAYCAHADPPIACKIAANDPAGPEVHAGLGLPPGPDDLRPSASSPTWHSGFACASDTVVITGQPVADPGDAYAPGPIG